MPLTIQPLPYGLRDIRLTPYTNDTTLGTAVDLPAARTLTFSESESFDELRGDDKVITTRGSGAEIDWELEEGGISIEAYKIMAGGTITSSGTTPAQVKTLSKLVTDARPFFKIEGQAISDSGGDFHVVLYRCRATGDIAGELTDGAFWLTKCKGKAFPNKMAPLDALYDFVQNETAIAIP